MEPGPGAYEPPAGRRAGAGILKSTQSRIAPERPAVSGDVGPGDACVARRMRARARLLLHRIAHTRVSALASVLQRWALRGRIRLLFGRPS